MTAIVRRAGMAALVLLAVPAAALADTGGAKPNPLSPNLVNAGVTVLVFLALLAVLRAFAWGPIMAGLQAREDANFAALDEARKAKGEAEELRVKLAADMAAAQDKVRGLIEEARRDADILRQKEREAGVKDAQEERERAKREILAAKDAALKEIYDSSVQLAATMSAKTIARQITPDDHRRLLDESLAELAAAVKASA
ncbi:MAG: hypothetical protein ACRC7O_16905 [Fimbriiglobus sp.]